MEFLETNFNRGAASPGFDLALTALVVPCGFGGRSFRPAKTNT
jgi:hypothetical protein